MSDAEMEDPLDEVWSEMKVHFLLETPKIHSTPTSWPRMSDNAIGVLRDHPKSVTAAFEYLQHQLEHTLNEVVVPEFWKIFQGTQPSDTHVVQHLETLSSHPFVTSVNFLFRQWKRQMEVASKMDVLGQDLGHQCRVLGQKSYAELYPVLLRGTLHSQLPHDFEKFLLPFYDATFHVFYVRQNSRFNADPDDSVTDGTLNGCEGCRKDEDQCQCDKVLSIFNELNQQLIQMGLLERLTFNALTQTIHNRIEKHVQETCQGSFTISHLQKLEEWLDQVVMSWLRLLYVKFDPLQELALRSFRGRLVNHLYEVYTKTRIDQLFNIIIEFPDSQPALEDLKDCLGRTGLRPTLTENLTKVLSKKLLHLGVNTTDILTAYIAAIRALRVLDPSGVVLEVVCAPVRTYLRTREDTVRCIVQSLIDDSSSELADELKKNEGLSLDDSFYEEQDMDNWESWVPDPIDAPSISKGRRTSDIISMLVNIYGSKELFVNEYRSLLSNRLLSHFTYDTEKEIRNLELLKLRFGDAPLHQCEVMLKDIGDSKRINTSLHSVDAGSAELNRQAFPVNAVILSAQFWPQFKQETLQLPQSVAQSLDVYTKAFETVKGNRTLVWKPHLGFANIDLELGDKKINLTVSPVHAAIIYQFQVKAEWTSEELAQTLKIPLATLRRRIVFWQTQGLVREISPDRNWNYDNQDDWDDMFPQCAQYPGIQQSPIDVTDNLMQDLTRKIYLQDYDAKVYSIIQNTGHGVRLFIQGSRLPVIQVTNDFSIAGVALEKRVFVLAAIDIHWGTSEHALNGQKTDAEIQFHHFDWALQHFETALNTPGGVLSMAVLLKKSDKVSNLSPEVFRGLRNATVPSETGILSDLTRFYWSSELISGTFGVYRGSMTMPPCLPNINWLVSSQIYKINQEQLDILTALKNKSGDFMLNTSRNLQINLGLEV